MQLNLLEKTELRVYGVAMQTVNLCGVAAAAAAVLELPLDKVIVVDVREDHICLDLLVQNIDIRQVVGREKALLAALAAVEGLTLADGAYVDSAGIMGLIACDGDDTAELVARAERLGGEVERGVLRRALVYATGFEVKGGMIEDTNSPYLLELLAGLGYKAEFGGILDDAAVSIAYKLRDAAERGFGLVVTTGGVGAEDKDCSVEATTRLDPGAATPWIVKFAAGTGRHVKDGVRIGVGTYGLTTIVNLPGPHDEVVAVAPAIGRHCRTGRIDKAALAGEVANILRDKLRHKHLACRHQLIDGRRPMDKELIVKLARELYAAETGRAPVEALTARHPEITNEDAYRVQLAGMDMRLADGHILVGKKIGLTSKVMQTALGVFEPDYGYITDRIMVFEGDALPMEELIAPKVEAEIAFVLKHDLKGPGVTVARVLSATAGVMPALEIIDTRIKDWKIKIQDTIADGASIGRIVASGRLTPVSELDLRYVGLVLEKNGEVVATAAGAAVLGHPANAVAWLANKLAQYDIGLKAGEIIMSGSLTAACPVAAGDNVRAVFDRLGTVGARFGK